MPSQKVMNMTSDVIEAPVSGEIVSGGRKLSKKDVNRAAWRWIFFHQSAHNYERMMGLGFAHSMSGALQTLYGDNKEGLAQGLTRNMAFFNTEPQLGSVIPGVTLALEETYAEDPNFDPEAIPSTKNALMGPIAGIGDSLLVGTLNPILLSIGIGMSSGGSPVGAAFFLLVWLAIVVPMQIWTFRKGHEMGLDAVTLLMDQRLKDRITTGLTMVGLIVIGGVAASTVKATVIWKYTAGEMTVDVQKILNGIMPGLVPLMVALTAYWLVSKKGWTPNKLILGILAFALVMVVLGIM